MLGFMRRNCLNICDIGAIKSLYNCLVRSLLKYNSVIWCPVYNCHVQRLERIQNKFVKFLLFKLRFSYRNVPYVTRIQLERIESLQRRRSNALACFLFRLVNGQINCDALLSLITFQMPNRLTRSCQLFHSDYHRTIYGSQRFSSRLMRNYNVNFEYIDLLLF